MPMIPGLTGTPARLPKPFVFEVKERPYGAQKRTNIHKQKNLKACRRLRHNMYK